MSTKESADPRQPLRKSWYHHLDPLLRGPTPPVPEQRQVCPEATAGLLGRLSFSWMTNIMVVGRRRAIEMGDIWLISPERGIERLTDRFHEALRARDRRGKTAHRLLLTMHDVFKVEFWTGALWLLTTSVCHSFIPFTLRYLLNYLEASYNYSHGNGESGTEPSIGHGLAYVIAMLAMQLLRAVSTNQYVYYGMRNGAQARALLISIVFGKSLDLSLQARTGSPEKGDGKAEGSNGSRDGYSSSRLLTMMSSDVARIDMAAGSFHSIWMAPVQMLLTFALLLVNLGYSAVTGFVLLFLGVATLTYAVKMLVGRRRAINIVTDDRNARTVEILEAIGAVKYGGMEGPLLSRINALRGTEVELVTRLNVIRNALNAFSIALPLFAAGISLSFYANAGQTLSVAPVFSSLALFMSLRQPFNALPRAIGQGADAWSAFQRLELLFDADEFKDYVNWEADEKDAVRVDQATFTWTDTAGEPDSEELPHNFLLDNIDFSVRPSELLAVVGSVGSGKSSLLSALRGAMHKVKGEVNIGTDTMAFCPQQAWIRNATLRENVVFDRPFDAERYARVLECCCLGPDIESLPSGDWTDIGERGATLSGGQKQRVNLARTLYSESDLVLLDDPLSAVDAHVGTSIFQTAICGYLRDRTRILSTHQLHILSRCDRVLWLDGGRIKALDSFANLHDHNAEFRALVASHHQPASSEMADSLIEGGQEHRAMTEANLAPGKGTLPAKEDTKEGDMSWGLLARYLRGSGSALYGFIPLMFLVLAQGSNTLTSVWLSMWTSRKFDISTTVYIAVLMSIAVAQALFLSLFGAAVSVLCGWASRELVNTAINQVVHATMAFHDSTPLGRIVNRLSRDVELVDNQLPESVRMFAYTVAIVASVVVLITAYIPWFVIAVPPLVAVIVYAATYYTASATHFKRFEATLRGVVYARASEGIAGFDAIRTYGARGPTTQRLYSALNDMTSAYFLTVCSQRWVATRLDLVAIAMIIGVSLLTTFLRHSLDPSVSGMLLSYSIAFTQMIQLAIRQLSEVENSMVSVERLAEYATTLPQEAPPPPEGCVHIPPGWPDKGHIALDSVQARYGPGLPNALDGINLTVESGQKVAVVGRTGAGKSTIAASLFRLVELSSGSITVDGLDIARVPLSELRSRLCIVPQEPKMFRGTLRANLDPFGERTDSVLWDVMRKVQLRDEVEETDECDYLDMVVEDHGSNLSNGQRQLISVARALLCQSSIVVCDEATSSIDLGTDKRIQDIMIQAFAGRTVITIAHRLRTIVGYDMVCVMDHGRIAEQGRPHELWLKQESIFRSLCDKDGIESHHFFKEDPGVRRSN